MKLLLNKERYANGNLPIFAVGLFYFLLQCILGADSYQISDPLVKLIQAYSYRHNGWQSEDFFYLGRSWDPEYRLLPVTIGFVLNIQDMHVSQYPVLSAFFYSLLPFAKIEFGVYGNAAFLTFLLFLLRKLGNISLKGLLYLTFGTVLFPLLFEFSENSIFFLFCGIGYLLVTRYENKRKDFDVFLGFLFLGFGVWLRLEALPGKNFLCAHETISGGFGLSLLEKNVLTIRKPRDLEIVKEIFSKHRPNQISLIGYSQNSPYAEKLYNPISELRYIAIQNSYKCLPQETDTSRYQVFFCDVLPSER